MFHLNLITPQVEIIKTIIKIEGDTEIWVFCTKTSDNNRANFLLYHGAEVSILIDFMERVLGNEAVKFILKQRDIAGNNVFMFHKYPPSKTLL